MLDLAIFYSSTSKKNKARLGRKRLSAKKGSSAKKPTTIKTKHLTGHQIQTKKNEIAEGRSRATIKEGRHTIYISFSPRDIICFRFPPEHLAACVFLEWDKFLTRLPFFQLPYCSEFNLAFEFEDGWEKGLKPYIVRDHLSETSVRGLIMRLHWSWALGKIPRWTRIYLINPRNDLPIRYKFGEPIRPPCWDDILYEKFRFKHGQDYVFFDGKTKFVDSCSWEGYIETFPTMWREIPIRKFMFIVDRFCRPPGTESLRHIPGTAIEHCLRVLRQLPNINNIP